MGRLKNRKPPSKGFWVSQIFFSQLLVVEITQQTTFFQKLKFFVVYGTATEVIPTRRV